MAVQKLSFVVPLTSFREMFAQLFSLVIGSVVAVLVPFLTGIVQFPRGGWDLPNLQVPSVLAASGMAATLGYFSQFGPIWTVGMHTTVYICCELARIALEPIERTRWNHWTRTPLDLPRALLELAALFFFVATWGLEDAPRVSERYWLGVGCLGLCFCLRKWHGSFSWATSNAGFWRAFELVQLFLLVTALAVPFLAVFCAVMVCLTTIGQVKTLQQHEAACKSWPPGLGLLVVLGPLAGYTSFNSADKIFWPLAGVTCGLFLFESLVLMQDVPKQEEPPGDELAIVQVASI